MKILVIDVGNTSTAVGLWHAGRVTSVTHHDGPAARRPDAFRAAREICARHAPCVASYVSVVPKADATWRRFTEKTLRIAFSPVTSACFTRRAPFAIRLNYPHPETIGADRLADAVAAVARYGAPVLVCDFGTAFTAAVVTADGVWRGGVIAPGFPLMRDYLFERTAKLPRLTLGGKAPKIGRSTEGAMRFGALVGYRGMVREIVSTLQENFRTTFTLVATGGFAKWVLSGARLPFIIDPTLTLQGAGLIACAEQT